MKITKITLSVTTVLFSLLGLLKILSFDVAQPLMMTSLATLLILIGIELKKKRENLNFILTIFAAIFLYVVIIYNVFIG